MTLLAAFQTLLHLCSGSDDIAVGSAVANRNRTDQENLVGIVPEYAGAANAYHG